MSAWRELGACSPTQRNAGPSRPAVVGDCQQQNACSGVRPQDRGAIQGIESRARLFLSVTAFRWSFGGRDQIKMCEQKRCELRMYVVRAMYGGTTRRQLRRVHTVRSCGVSRAPASARCSLRRDSRFVRSQRSLRVYPFALDGSSAGPLWTYRPLRLTSQLLSLPRTRHGHVEHEEWQINTHCTHAAWQTRTIRILESREQTLSQQICGAPVYTVSYSYSPEAAHASPRSARGRGGEAGRRGDRSEMWP